MGVTDGVACCDPVRLGVDDWLPVTDAVIDAETLALCDIVCEIELDCELDEDLEAVWLAVVCKEGGEHVACRATLSAPPLPHSPTACGSVIAK